MINYDALPSTPGSGFFKEPGQYLATIESAVMKASKTGGTPYLVVTYNLTDTKGKGAGKYFDNFFDSDKEIPLYKIKAFVDALQFGNLGAFELEHLTKICVGKSLIIKLDTDAKDPTKNTINVFAKDIYLPASNWAAVSGGVDTPVINAPDATDADGFETISGSEDDY